VLPPEFQRPDGASFKDLLYPYVRNGQIFFCPSVPLNLPVHGDPDNTYLEYGFTYMYNAFTEHFDLYPGYIIAGSPIDSAIDPSRAIVLWDDPCCGEGILESYHQLPHNHGINVTYADGHAKWSHVNDGEAWCCTHLWEGWKSAPFGM